MLVIVGLMQDFVVACRSYLCIEEGCKDYVPERHGTSQKCCDFKYLTWGSYIRVVTRYRGTVAAWWGAGGFMHVIQILVWLWMACFS